MSHKKQLLDPIGTVCRLISLNFEPPKTRVGIFNHAITIQPPTFTQWIQRIYNGDDRDNISEFYNVITRFIEWYVVPLYEFSKKGTKVHLNSTGYSRYRKESSESEEKSGESDQCMKVEDDIQHAAQYWECVRKLCSYLCDALSKLQETYSTGNVVLALQCYINLVKDGLNGTYTKDRLPKFMVNEQKTFLDYKKIKILWDYNKVFEIVNLYDKCFEIQNSVSTEEHIKYEKIRGYLLALDKLQLISDESFRKLLESSNQGS